ncbi:LysR substrate-binding domain-containing protein [Pseudoroseomonas wenyumeiae]
MGQSAVIPSDCPGSVVPTTAHQLANALERHGEPIGLVALRDHVAVGYADSRTGRPTTWAFQNGDQLHPVSMKTHVTVNDTDGYVAAGIAGMGLIRGASYMVRRPLAEGRLVRVLSELEAPAMPLSLCILRAAISHRRSARS